MPEQTQTAYSKSLWTDPTNLASLGAVLVGLLALPEVTALIPVTWMPAILAISGAINFLLRTFNAVRPVAMIAPGNVKPVEIPKLEKTEQGTETKGK
jgi:hypothetical protein